MNPNQHPYGLNINEDSDGHITIHIQRRLMGWVQPSLPLHGWLCNWRHDDGTWSWPHGLEAQEHLHPTQQAALHAVLERITP